jgi:transposase
VEAGAVIQVTAQMRVLVAVEPADFRRGIDGLARMARQTLASDPFSGWLFVFRNRRATAVKILVYDGQGFWLCHKRLSQGRFRFWPGGERGPTRALAAHELQVLLSAGNFAATGAAEPWRRMSSAG